MNNNQGRLLLWAVIVPILQQNLVNSFLLAPQPPTILRQWRHCSLSPPLSSSLALSQSSSLNYNWHASGEIDSSQEELSPFALDERVQTSQDATNVIDNDDDDDDDDDLDWFRFASVDELYGTGSLEVLANATVALIGLGSVGSFTAEALARSGVGRLVLMDLEDICISQTTSSLSSLKSNVGRFKIDFLQEHLQEIHPTIQTSLIYDFVKAKQEEDNNDILPLFLEDDEDNSDNSDGTSPTVEDFCRDVLVNQHGVDVVVDTIGQVEDKVSFLEACRETGLSSITIGQATGRVNPLDIATTTSINDPVLEKDTLLQDCRNRLAGQHEHLVCIASTEAPRKDELGHESQASLCTVTGAFGLAAASKVVELLLSRGTKTAGD